MNFKLTLACSLVFALPLPVLLRADEAKEMKEAADIFDFSDLDVATDPGTPRKALEKPAPEDPMPARAREVLRKWDTFQQSKQEARRTQVKALRQVASEIILKRAAVADAATRPGLVEEAKRLTALLPDAPVVPPVTAAKEPGLADTWSSEQGKHRWEFTADGKRLAGKHAVDWVWIDEKNKVALSVWDGKYPELIHVLGDKYETVDLYSPPGVAFRVKAVSVPAGGSATRAVLTKLAADERALTVTQEKVFAEKRVRLAAFIRAQVKEAKGPAVALLMEQSALLEKNGGPSPAGKPAGKSDRIPGAWEWPGGKKATFEPDGAARVEGLGTGEWHLGTESDSWFALVLRDKAGKVIPGQMMLCRFSAADTIHVVDLAGKRYDVRKGKGS